MKNREELVKQMSKNEITAQLLLSQAFLLVLGIAISAIFMEDFIEHWTGQWGFSVMESFWYAVVPVLFIISADLVLMKFLPRKHYDDGGINEKVFGQQSVFMIILLAMIVAISEEVLFRGVLQPLVGYIGASLLFALVHIRYLKKPVLLLSVLYISFGFGFIYERTQVLTYVIMAHFLVDVTLGLMTRFKRLPYR
ncbi:CPBP family intramembrane glutamic endopeptidase [Salimicrobium sp. PL1-032A]|uniref:CPBP family intramembrane glutamic endopeptidase n=1 Tax=Salimicrobium sp. PL1-032A TaxID=3095364 RepID=UPI00326041CC